METKTLTDADQSLLTRWDSLDGRASRMNREMESLAAKIKDLESEWWDNYRVLRGIKKNMNDLQREWLETHDCICYIIDDDETTRKCKSCTH